MGELHCDLHLIISENNQFCKKKAAAPELKAMRKEKTESVMKTHQKKSPHQMRIHAGNSSKRENKKKGPCQPWGCMDMTVATAKPVQGR